MAKYYSYVFTLNNYTDEEVEAVKEWDCKYLIFGKEVGESGTPHLQGYVSFRSQKTLSTMKKKFSDRAHWEAAMGTPKQASDYCSKDGDVFEKGTRPLSDKEKGQKEADRWEEAYKAVEEGRLEDLPKDLLCNRLKQIEYGVARVKASKRKVEALEGPRGTHHEWHYGVPGSGKTHYSESQGEFYTFEAGRFWDEYNDQEIVVFQDVDESQRPYVQTLKNMLDQKPFRAAEKGVKSRMIRPKRVIITSNLHPKEIWPGIHGDAIVDRVKIYHWPVKFGKPGWHDPTLIPATDPPSPNRFTSLPSRFN